MGLWVVMVELLCGGTVVRVGVLGATVVDYCVEGRYDKGHIIWYQMTERMSSVCCGEDYSVGVCCDRGCHVGTCCVEGVVSGAMVLGDIVLVSALETSTVSGAIVLGGIVLLFTLSRAIVSGAVVSREFVLVSTVSMATVSRAVVWGAAMRGRSM